MKSMSRDYYHIVATYMQFLNNNMKIVNELPKIFLLSVIIFLNYEANYYSDQFSQIGYIYTSPKIVIHKFGECFCHMVIKY